ncbi:MAG TPA: Ig-like domain-containing protein [Steroidobacteraceae bacterium]|nr:Ig-like domain-containing protein [Steroidobacteraceae bacterium]
MRAFKGFSKHTAWFAALLLGLLAAGCSRDPILGAGVASLAPMVTAVTPFSNAVGVPVTTSVTATFNEPMAPISGAASFTVTCAAPCVSPTGTVALNAANTIATFTLTAATTLAPLTLYTATITGATNLASGTALASPYTWQFTTTPVAPTVTAVAPVNNATGVAINSAIAAEFSEPMAPITGAASFTVTCAAPCVSPTGTVALDAGKADATFTPAANLAPSQLYTATITGATSLASGLALASPYVWKFTTGTTTDVTRPRVTLTVPATTTPGPTTGVPVNSAITATFTEAMAPATFSDTSFTVTCAAPCVSPTGTVSYQLGSNTAIFSPAAALTVGATYSATISTAATDLAGNELAGNQAALPAASNYVWTFTTSAAVTATNVAVKSTNPTAAQMGVCPIASVNATFTVPAGLRMDPSTINAATFTVTGPSPATTSVTAASVSLDTATGTVATFTPQTALAVGGTYTATIIGGANGVKDLGVPADDMLSDFTWDFTAGAATGSCLAPVSLGSAAPFGDFGGTAGMTNTGTLTVVNGDIGTIATGTSSITGFNDTAGDIYTESPANIGNVNGTIYTCTNSTTGPTSAGPNAAYCAVATQARLDAQTAYLTLAGMPPGANPGGNLAGLTLAPGVYTAPAGSFMMQGGNLTLDAGGNANAVWVFQMATTLTVGGPGAAAPQSVILAGGAQAKNVFWQVGAAATINEGGGGTMVGTIISQAGAAFSTAGNVAVVTLNGRALSLGASVTLVDTVINVPAP